MSEQSSVFHAGSLRAMFRKGKFEQFQKVPTPYMYTVGNNKQNALPTAYHVYRIIRIFLNAEENLLIRKQECP